MPTQLPHIASYKKSTQVPHLETSREQSQHKQGCAHPKVFHPATLPVASEGRTPGTGTGSGSSWASAWCILNLLSHERGSSSFIGTQQALDLRWASCNLLPPAMPLPPRALPAYPSRHPSGRATGAGSCPYADGLPQPCPLKRSPFFPTCPPKAQTVAHANEPQLFDGRGGPGGEVGMGPKHVFLSPPGPACGTSHTRMRRNSGVSLDLPDHGLSIAAHPVYGDDLSGHWRDARTGDANKNEPTTGLKKAD